MNVRSFAKTLVTLAAIALTSYFIEVHLHRKGVPGRDLILLSNVTVGMVGAALVYVLSVRERQRQQYVECRLRVIAEMNHHIRNALQVITFYSHKGQTQEVGILEAVDRIQWALREVLPQLPEQPTRKNDSRRVLEIQKFRATHSGSLN